uniref:Uncharacterized protein n=2 Tax=Anguilla anguilla TaxID=7936 RepID=A0A0E9SY82_ANGAN
MAKVRAMLAASKDMRTAPS